MRQLGLLAAAVALLACENKSSVNVSNSNATGTVGGVVLDVDGETPLMGAQVQLTTAGGMVPAVMTAADGSYSIPKVPVGNFFVTVSLSSYQSAYFPGALSGTVGNFPVSNPIATLPTVELFKNDGTF